MAEIKSHAENLGLMLREVFHLQKHNKRPEQHFLRQFSKVFSKNMNLKPNLTKLGSDQFPSHVPMVRLGGITLVFARTNK